MNKNLSLRIVGIGSIVLLVGSLFLPFVNYSGFTSNLFEGARDLYYMPYVLIAFSVISIITLILNKRKELSYLLVGASILVIITNTIELKDSFKYLSFGYYLLVLSSILLFISTLLLSNNSSSNDLVKPKKEENLESNVTNTNVVNDQIMNSEPSELAQSIMDQPVIKDLNSIDNNSINNQPIKLDDTISIDGIEDNNIQLSPQNPLSSFLPSDFDPTKINEDKNEKVDQDISIEENKKEDEQKVVDNSQSIMSIMSQPMVNSGLVSNSQVNNVSEIGVTPLSSISASSSMRPQPVVEPSMQSQPVVEPSMQPQPVVEPSMRPQSVVEPSMRPQSVVEPSMRPQPVMEPSISEIPILQSEDKSLKFE